MPTVKAPPTTRWTTIRPELPRESLPSRATDLPFLKQFLRNFAEKARGALEHFAVASVEAEIRIRKIKFVLRASDGDVEETAFFFDGVFTFEAAAAREHAVGHPDDEDDFPLEALGLVNTREGEHLGVVIRRSRFAVEAGE